MLLLFQVELRGRFLIDMENLKLLLIKLNSLTIFRALLGDKVLDKLLRYLSEYSYCEESDAVSLYADFVSTLFSTGSDNLADYIQRIVNYDENIYVTTVGKGIFVKDEILSAVNRELDILQEIANLSSETLIFEDLKKYEFLPKFSCKISDIKDEYFNRVNNIQKYGYGIYTNYHMFYVGSNNTIVPVVNPDTTRLSELIDYKDEQQVIINNTLALLQGKPAANILLTGDAGTGKSSTIKAVVNEYYNMGLRIIEVRKEQLREIPAILDELGGNPLKFILFIDDLSFKKDDDNYSSLKAILEGSVSAKTKNVVIYATSNRRHLVKESFSDRDGDDVHRNDTMQEIISLSERFGIRVNFQKPDKNTYLDIVRHLASDKGIKISVEELESGAERFALERGGRSARAARQYIDKLLAKI